MKIKRIFLFACLFAVLGSLTFYLVAVHFRREAVMRESTWSEVEQRMEWKTVPLPRQVKYYEEQLDPEIPKIKVTVRQFGDGCAVDYTLPYDGTIRQSAEETETDQKKTWFADLMNNFQSLPVLYDGYGYHDTEDWEEVPAHFNIQFEQPPTGEIIVKDYGIFNQYGVATEAGGKGHKSVGYRHTFEAAQELEFDLWLYDGIHSLSALPELRGLVVECEIDGKQMEYSILFQVDYGGGAPFYQEDLSHLTPLEQ